MDDITQILQTANSSDDSSAQALLPLVYEELRKLAGARMASSSSDHTLQPTALVHEAWLRMVDDSDRTWHNRAYFFAAASTAMRNILIDHARKKMSKKRGGDRQRLDFDQIDLATPEPDEIMLLIEEALQRLEQVNPKWAKIVVMKYFGGMTHKEVSEALGLSESTVERCWAGAKTWLYKQIRERV